MSRLFQKPANVSYDDIEKYVDSYDGSDDLLFFKYIYLLCKKSILDRKIKFENNDTLNTMTIKGASDIFELMLSDNNLNFDDAFDKIIKSVVSSTTIITKEVDESIGSLESYILHLYDKYTLHNKSDILNFSEYIRFYMSLIPKSKNSSEWLDVYKSVLLSFNKTINYYKTALFDYRIDIHPKIVLYNCDKKYRSLIMGIVLKLTNDLRDNFNKIISGKSISKSSVTFMLHFKESRYGQ